MTVLFVFACFCLIFACFLLAFDYFSVVLAVLGFGHMAKSPNPVSGLGQNDNQVASQSLLCKTYRFLYVCIPFV